MTKILITGLSGLLGNNLAFAYRNKYGIAGVYNNHKVDIGRVEGVGMNLLDRSSLSRLTAEFQPEIVIHCAALSDVDRCEEDKKLAYDLNVEITKNITEYSKKHNSHLIYISTDCVYDGREGNLKEENVNPVNYYGETKLLGEKAALEYSNTLVIRTNFFGRNVQKKFSLAEWVLYSLSKNKTINGFGDAIFSAMYTFLLADVMEKAFVKGLKGIYNLASSDNMSKYDFAVSIADIFKLNKALIKKTTIEAFGFKAKRAKNMGLNIDKISKDLSITLPTMMDSIIAFHRDYNNEARNDMRKRFNYV